MTAAADTNLFRELWISFSSLIRSYVAAHDIGRPVGHALVDEGEDGHLSIRTEGRILSISYDGMTGAGTWAVYENDPGPERLLKEGSFSVSEDSLVGFSDRRDQLELEVAAEAFTAMVFDEE